MKYLIDEQPALGSFILKAENIEWLLEVELEQGPYFLWYYRLYNAGSVEKATKLARISVKEPVYIFPDRKSRCLEKEDCEPWFLSAEEAELFHKLIQQKASKNSSSAPIWQEAFRLLNERAESLGKSELSPRLPNYSVLAKINKDYLNTKKKGVIRNFAIFNLKTTMSSALSQEEVLKRFCPSWITKNDVLEPEFVVYNINKSIIEDKLSDFDLSCFVFCEIFAEENRVCFSVYEKLISDKENRFKEKHKGFRLVEQINRYDAFNNKQNIFTLFFREMCFSLPYFLFKEHEGILTAFMQKRSEMRGEDLFEKIDKFINNCFGMGGAYRKLWALGNKNPLEDFNLEKHSLPYFVDTKKDST